MHNSMHNSMHNGMYNGMHNCVRGQTQPRANAAEDESGGRAPGTPNAEAIEGSSRIQVPKKLSIVAAERLSGQSQSGRMLEHRPCNRE